MSSSSRLLGVACSGLLYLISPQLLAQVPGYSGGHAKGQFLLNALPDDSLFLDEVDTPMQDLNGDLRLKFDWSGDAVSLAADYQLIGRHGDQVVLSRQYPELVARPDSIASDARRLFDLTHVISEDDNSVLVHRLDRLSLDTASDRAVFRLGRQAVSWGNGLIYTPMDIFNPFDPAAVDTEYKTGDDMAYAQYLRDNGDDLQGVWVVRRDAEGEVTQQVNSLALKYHGFAGDTEYDLLLAEHYDELILGIGGLRDVGGAILRGDLTLTDTADELVASLVTSLSYSWVTAGHNVSGILEYFYNGFGQPDGEYSQEDLASNTELIARLGRGELFTLGQHYIAASAMVEVSPLWLLTPNLFFNASDGSAFVQLVSSYDFRQNWQLLAALSVPIGPAGTEYGGIESQQDGKTLGTGPGLFMQLAWYF